MNAISWMIERFGWLSEYFYKAYLEILDLPWPIWYAAWPFYAISEVFSQLSWDLWDFYTWVADVSDRIVDVLSWDNIVSWLEDRYRNLTALNSWFYNWRNHVTGVVSDWWSGARQFIIDWIDTTRAWAKLWIDYLQDQVDELRVMIQDLPGAIPDLSFILEWFTDWPGHVSSVVDNWWSSTMGDVQGLIDSNLKTWFPFYDDLVGLWSGIKEFFTDPEDWLYKSMDRIIERFW